METTETPEPYRLTTGDLFDMNKSLDMEQALTYLTEDTERLSDLLMNARRSMARATERIAHNETRATRAERVAQARDELRDYDRRALGDSLQTLHEDGTPLPLDSPEWVIWLRLIITAGVLAGQDSDVHNLCIALGADLSVDAREVWRETSASLRGEDGTYPEPVPSEQAIAQALRKYRHSLGHHVSDPRLSDGWARVWRVAKGAGLCDVWDTMAEQLGVPPVAITKSGYVTVTGSFSVEVYVDGVTDDDVDISHSDVIEAMDRHDISIDEWDTSALEMD